MFTLESTVEYPMAGIRTLTEGNTVKAWKHTDAVALTMAMGWVMGATAWKPTLVAFEKGKELRQVKFRVRREKEAVAGHVMMPLPRASVPLAWAEKVRSFILTTENPVG